MLTTMKARAKLGTTLLEVMFAVVLFSGIATALMTVWLTHFRAIDQAQNFLAATAIADGKLAEQAGLAFKAKDDASFIIVKRSLDGVTTDYRYDWEVKVTDHTLGSPDIKEVKVTVKWEERGQTKQLIMVTCVYWQG